VPLGRQLPLMRIAAYPAEPVRSAGSSVKVRLVASESAGWPVRLEALGCERWRPGSNRELERGFRRIWRGAELAALFGTQSLPARGRLDAVMQLPGLTAADRRLVIKLAGRDRRGRAAVAWATVAINEPPVPAIAARPAAQSAAGQTSTR